MSEEEKKHPNENITITAEGSSADDENTADPGELVESTIAPAISQPGVILFPFALTPLVLDNPKVISLIEKAAGGDRLITVFPEMPDKDSPMSDVQGIELNTAEFDLGDKKVSATGVLCRLVKSLRFPDGTVRVLMRGLSRVRFVEALENDGAKVRVERLAQTPDNSIETVAMVRNAVKQFQEIISFSPNFPEELKIAILNLTDNTRIVDLIADTINISYLEKLAILTLPALQERLHLLTILLNREVEVLRLGSEIQSQVHNAMSKSQREFFLREQLRTIKEELGEGNRNPDIQNIQERMSKLELPEKVSDILKKELERLDMIPQAAAEYNIAYTYIDWLLSVPWNNFTEDRLDVREAARLLDRDHYGLKDIKERILEFLAVLQLKNDRKSPIICFVGPPGVGKTSLGKSIAEAMGRKFVRMSLGGVRDEAEIRGHRRTYIGALPGRIIQGLKKAGSSNPVFMLDEIDKLGNDFRGDPSAALLEVLDPQQNHAFNDHYLEVDYDLSSVMFIATANITETIPGPLLDRMDIVRLPGYTATEKLHIAEQFLIPRQLKENGFDGREVKIASEAVDELINYYTREAGVRQLERTIGQVLRKLAREIVEGRRDEPKTLVGVPEIHTLLGARKFLMDEAMQKPEIGVATGMAWTSVGGTILQVEAVSMPGKGDLKLTGSLGDVMKESAVAAFSYIKGHSAELGIDDSLFTKRDFHVHVPDGATPKDGPSAGVTLATALVSLLTGRPVRADYAMTGEINLRGRVTAIGGVKEKAIGALRAGIKNIILPMENKKDLEDIPEEVLKQVHFQFASTIGEVLDIMLLKPVGKTAAAPKKTASGRAGTRKAEKKMTKFLAMLGALLFLLPSAMIGQSAAEKMSPEDFLARVRNPPGRDSWAKMKGSAQHLREGARPIQAPIEMGIFFTPVRTVAQIRFNGNEVYNIGQSYGKDASTSVEKLIPAGVTPQIGVYGITPEDLAMSFLYWKFKEEQKMETLRGQDCRVFLLENKDGSEQVRVAINCEYFFPMRAEWFRLPGKTPVRTLEASAFKKESDFWFVSKILLSGKDWSTAIRFNEVDAGIFKGQLPPGVFQQ